LQNEKKKNKARGCKTQIVADATHGPWAMTTTIMTVADNDRERATQNQETEHKSEN